MHSRPLPPAAAEWRRSDSWRSRSRRPPVVPVQYPGVLAAQPSGAEWSRPDPLASDQPHSGSQSTARSLSLGSIAVDACRAPSTDLDFRYAGALAQTVGMHAGFVEDASHDVR